MQIRTFILSFDSSRLIENRVDLLRGYFGRRFEEYVLMHHHRGYNSFLYSYPLVQYKMLNGKAIVIGIQEGADVLNKIYKDVNVIDVNGIKYEIFERNISLGNFDYEYGDKTTLYSFLTPWLALNGENYEKYRGLGSWQKKKELLEKILVGNIISMSKGLGYTVPEPIKAEILKIREVKTSLKRTPMLGFLGEFAANFEIPDYFGLGKSVSRGFGTVMRVEELVCNKKYGERK